MVDAVQCAVFIQNEMTEREKKAPDDRKIRYRIAVNLGDVIVEGDDSVPSLTDRNLRFHLLMHSEVRNPA